MIYAMFAMIVLTFSVAGYLLKLRIDAVKSGQVKLGVFRLNNNTDIPPKMQQASRNYTNLFEMPTLFYGAGILAIVLHLNTPSLVVLGWFFVASRAVHSWIHLTSNNVIHRMQAFMAGNICVVLMWIILVVEYSAQHTY
jgi:hypothetical protein